jgi:hypothetical protein
MLQIISKLFRLIGLVFFLLKKTLIFVLKYLLKGLFDRDVWILTVIIIILFIIALIFFQYLLYLQSIGLY